MLGSSGFMSANGIEIIVNEKDYAETQHIISEKSLNLYEYVHGGVYYSLADAAAGVASRSDGDSYVTLNSAFNYMKASKSGCLRACASVKNRTSKICVVEVLVKDQHNDVLSSGTFTMYRVSKR